MARSKHRSRRRERDETLDAAAIAPAAVRAQSSLTDHVLSLQRDYGNAAVTAVVQRRDAPQSTDAPGHHEAPHTPPGEDYAPTEHNPKFSDWSDADLNTRGNSELDSTVRNAWYFAAELFEEYWFRHQGRAAALGPYRAYKKMGDAKREAFWLGVMQGTVKPGSHSAEDQTGKEF